MSNINYHRLHFLSQKVKSAQATKSETDEYMELLYQNNSITPKQFKDYKAGRNKEDILGASIVIGGIVLLGYLLGKVTE